MIREVHKPISKYWTIVNLQPRSEPLRSGIIGFDDPVPEWDHFRPDDAATSFLTLVYHSILKAVVAWGGLVTYFDKFLDEGKVFMDPTAHDNLLVDDEAFSRSRKYFWALSCLSELQTCIDDNIHQWDTSRTIWETALANEDDWPNASNQMKEIEIWVDKLRLYAKCFKEHHERVFALRDGLFNASAVMESRDANKLGGEFAVQRFSQTNNSI